MAKILSFSPKFAARGKTTPSQKRGFLRLKSKHAEEAQSVRTPRKDERQNKGACHSAPLSRSTSKVWGLSHVTFGRWQKSTKPIRREP